MPPQPPAPLKTITATTNTTPAAAGARKGAHSQITTATARKPPVPTKAPPTKSAALPAASARDERLKRLEDSLAAAEAKAKAAEEEAAAATEKAAKASESAAVLEATVQASTAREAELSTLLACAGHSSLQLGGIDWTSSAASALVEEETAALEHVQSLVSRARENSALVREMIDAQTSLAQSLVQPVPLAVV